MNILLLEIRDELIRRAEKGTVICNLRPNQRSQTKESPTPFVDEPLISFLKSLKPGSNVLVHYQELDMDRVKTSSGKAKVSWTDDGYPRLDVGSNEIWGNFILAVTQCPENTDSFDIDDPAGRIFIELLDEIGQPMEGRQILQDDESERLFIRRTKPDGGWDGDKLLST